MNCLQKIKIMNSERYNINLRSNYDEANSLLCTKTKHGLNFLNSVFEKFSECLLGAKVFVLFLLVWGVERSRQLMTLFFFFVAG